MTAEDFIASVGLGNSWRGDDGVGPAVIQALWRADLPDGVILATSEAPGLELIHYFERFEAVIIVDGLAFGEEPGTIFRFPPEAIGLMDAAFHSHGITMSLLLTTARLRGKNPEVIVYAVEIGSLEPDQPLTPAVAAAAITLKDLIVEDVRRRAAKTRSADKGDDRFA